MRSYLQFQSLWQIVSGQWELPDELNNIQAVDTPPAYIPSEIREYDQ
ncbi:hypothetical protein EST38_g14380 [Candolleomyces aberdarensis]|uniref:Uncharacterized protein n=1 Tax=Candolleomyces aberdarensis TaxID=2316362 RepID=A0A4Q2D041_9AGAR|nr:hypothetical protein EST38_g14380 [Candolleomyces aberdarensis]